MKFYDRTTTVTVNGRDYSDEFNGLSVGFESYVAATGMIKKTGTLNLCEVRNSAKTLDPRVNRDFFPGAIVNITWNSSPHPLAGEMLLMAPPTASAIDSSLPVVPGNIAVTLELGCNLAYYDVNQPDSDQTGFELGDDPIESISLIRDFLIYGGISAAYIDPGFSGGLFVSGMTETLIGDNYTYAAESVQLAFSRLIKFPITKSGGSFVSLAASLAYSATGVAAETEGDPPALPVCGFLFCDNANIVRFHVPEFTGIDSRLSRFTRELGLDELSYEPQIDGQILPGTIRLSSTAYSIAQELSLPSVEVALDSQDRIITRKTTTKEISIYEEPEPGSLSSAPSSPFPSPYWVGIDNIFPSLDKKSWIKTTTTIEQREKDIIPGSESFIIALSEKLIEVDLYDGDRRVNSISIKIVPLVTIVPGIVDSDNFSLSLSTIILNSFDVCSDITVIRYTPERTGSFASTYVESPDPGYDSSIVTTSYTTRGILNPGRTFNPNEIEEIHTHVLLEKSLQQKETWTLTRSESASVVALPPRPRSWQYSLSRLVPKILSDPLFSSDSEDDYYFMAIGSGLKKNGVQILPPNAVYLDQGLYVQEDLIKAIVNIGDGSNPRENSIAVEYGFSVESLEKLGEYESKIIAGRQYQYLIQIGWEGLPSAYSAIPMQQMTIKEPSPVFPYTLSNFYQVKHQLFTIDALSWNHQPNGIVSVGFAGIFMGTIGTTNVLIPESSYGEVITFDLPGSLNTVVVEIDLPIEVGRYITIVDETTGTNYYFLVTNVSGLNITLKDITPDTDIAGTEISGVPNVSATLPSGYAPDDDGILQPFTIVPVTSQVTVPIGGELVRTAILYSVSYDGFIY